MEKIRTAAQIKKLAKEIGMHAGDPRWEQADAKGWSIAHAAAEEGRLPYGFDRW
ncbi:MAG: hypothetical protein LBR80_10905 [Deltaproteobacteria bacterium]|jgi:hypothetical protein|nr:hypothetical protein [Deltaproteobacteria bacterium]